MPMKLSKVAAVAASGVVATLALSGCMRMEVDVQVDKNAEISGAAVTVAVPKEMPAAMGDLMGDAEPLTMESFKASVVEQSGGGVTEEACVFSETDTEFVAVCDAPAEELVTMTGGADGLMLSLDGGTISATVPTDDTAGTLNMFGMESYLNLHFPGAVESVSGAGAVVSEQDGTVVIIDMMATDGEPVVITASNGSADLTLIWVALLGVALLGGAAVILLVSGNKDRSPAPAPSDDFVEEDVVVGADASGRTTIYEETIEAEGSDGNRS